MGIRRAGKSFLLYQYIQELLEQGHSIEEIFLIQNIDGWELFAHRLADEKRRVLITGCNAIMLSHEISSVLSGRYVLKEIYPLSLTEWYFF